MTGSGTVLDPYIISDVDDLQAMNDDLAAYYELGQDIDASATSGWNGGAGFVPIGNPTTQFTGQLDGKNYKITGLFINRVLTTVYVGLFGYINGGVVQNLSMEGFDFTGRNRMGGMVGCMDSGTISDSYVENGTLRNGYYSANVGGFVGLMTGGTIQDCHVDTVTHTAGNWGIYRGGFIGNFTGGTITKCYVDGGILPSTAAVGSVRIGGFVGSTSGGTISRCFTTMAVSGRVDNGRCGGFVGEAGWGSSGTIQNCYARGDVAGDDDIGGFAGTILGGTVDKCYSTGAPSGDESVGGFSGSGSSTNCCWDKATSGKTTSSSGIGKTTAQMKAKATFIGWNFASIWGLTDASNDGYPCLLEVTPSCVACVVARHHPIHAIIPNIPYRRLKPELTLAGG